MKHSITCLMAMAFFSLPVSSQIKNGNYNYGSDMTSPHTVNSWSHTGVQWVPQDYVRYEDPFIDLTGTMFGNGKSISQKTYLKAGVKYRLNFDLGSFYGWDLWDAGVSVSIDGKPLGNRIFHQQFSYSRDTFMYWKRMNTIEFYGNNDSVLITITGNSELVQSYGFGSGVGVIGLDNVALEEVQSTQVNPAGNTDILRIFPNPVASDHIRISGFSAGANARYTISDASGKCIRQGYFMDNTIPADHLLPGLYFLQIADPGGKPATGRFTITAAN